MLLELIRSSWRQVCTIKSAQPRAYIERMIDCMELEDRTLFSFTPAGIPVVAADPSAAAAPATTSTVPSPSSVDASAPFSAGPPSSATGAAVTVAPNQSAQDVVLIDTELKNSSLLIQAVDPSAKVFLYDSKTDSADAVISQVIAWSEATGTSIKSLSLLDHGVGGAFELGNQWITAATLSETAAQWQQLAQHFVAGANIDLFGCNVAAPGSDGQYLLNDLAALTGAEVFASTNTTGVGGDWNLEAASAGATGDLAGLVAPFNSQILATYDGTLATIAIDHTTTPTSSGNISSLTWAHTVGSGSNGILIVEVAIHEDKHNESVASVTYGGQALTRLEALNSSNNVDAEMWYLLAPMAGTANVVVTLNGDATEVVANATDYFGVNQATPFGNHTSTAGTSAAPSATIASATGQLVIDNVAYYNDMSPLTRGAGQTQLWSNSTGGGGGDAFGIGSYKTGAASVTMSWSSSKSDFWAMNVAALRPATGDTPVITAPASGSLAQNSTFTFSSGGGNPISISDPDAGTNNVQLTLSVANGTLTLGTETGLTFAGGADGTGTMTIQGTLANINTALDGLVYTPNNNYAGNENLALAFNDLGASGFSPETANASVALTVLSDTPVNAVPGAQTVNENSTLTFNAANGNAISVADDAGDPLDITLSASNGTISLSQTTGLTFTTGTGTGDATMEFSGTLTDINNALNNLVYTPTNNYFGSDTIQLTSADNVAAGGPFTDSSSIGVTVVEFEPPSNIVPGPQSTNENTGLVFSSANGNVIAVDDDAGHPTVTLTAADGTLTLNGTTGLSFTSGTGTGDASMSFSGTLADVNAALDGLTYNPTTNFSGSTNVQITSSDPAAPPPASDTVNVTVNHVNATPTNTVPAAQSTNENTALVFSSGGGNAISVSDPAAGTNPLQITLTAGNGTLTLNGTTGLTFSTGTGSGDATMTFTGTITDINTALDGLSFQPANNYYGAASVQITSVDNTGVGPAQSASDTVNVTVNHVPPSVVTSGGSLAYTENDPATSIDSGVTVTDVDSPTIASATVTISANYVNGQDVLAFTNTGAITGSFNAATGTLTLTGVDTVANYQAALRSVTYVNTSEMPSTAMRTISFVADDGIGSSSAATRNITVASVDDAPINTVPGAQAVNDTTTLIFSAANGNQISLADVDANGSAEQLALSVGSGKLTLSGTTGLTFVSGANGSSSMTVQGTLANLNAALNGLTYTPPSTLTNNSSDTLNLTTNDLGNTGAGGPQTANSSVTINLTHVNRGPAESTPSAQTMNEDGTLVFSAANGNQISTSDFDSNGASEQVTLTATNGTLTLNGTSGLTFSAGTGTGDTTMTFTGTLVNINAALNGLAYNPTFHYFGAANVSISTNDLGNTGSGGALSASSTVNVTVNEVNQAPSVTVPGSQQAQSTTLVFSATNGNQISINDIDTNGSPVQLTLVATGGTMTLATTAGLTFSSGSSSNSTGMTFTGTVANINAALNGLAFHPTTNSANLQVTVNDLGNTGLGGAKTATGSVAVAQVPLILPPSTNNNNNNNPQTPVTPMPVAPIISPATTITVANTGDRIGPLVDRPTHVWRELSAVPQSAAITSQVKIDQGLRLREPTTEFATMQLMNQARSEATRPKIQVIASSPQQASTVDIDTLWTQIDAVSKQLDEALSSETMTIGVTTGVSVALSTGYVVWLLRAGSLLASVLSSLPAWRSFDPLPVLDFWEKEKRAKQEREAKSKKRKKKDAKERPEEESLQTMVTT
jgi:hypothetical protein